jgi:uncharacterized membrane protein YphA (DoxX/SURF4 family)
MRAFKIVLSVIAGLVGVAAGVSQLGHWVVSPAVAELLLSIAGMFSMFGVQPIRVPVFVARVLGAFSMVISGVVASHSGGAMGAAGSHAWMFTLLGCIGVVIGLAARFPTPPPPPAPPADQIPPDKLKPSAS